MELEATVKMCECISTKKLVGIFGLPCLIDRTGFPTSLDCC